MKSKGYLTVFIFFVALPLILFVAAKTLQGASFSWANLGEFFGVMSLSFFAATITLSLRFPFLEKYFGSLNRQYRLHILFAQLALSFAILHPLLLLFRYAASFAEAVDFLWFPTYMEGLLPGFISLMLFIGVVFVSLYFRLPYHIWKMTHKLAGPAFLLAYIHILEVEPAIFEKFFPLEVYMHLLSWVALAAFSHQSVLRPLLRKYKLKVLDYKKLNDNVLEIEIEKPENFHYKAGQFAFLSFNVKGLKELHPFSFVSSSRQNSLRFAIKNLGDYTARLPKLIKNASFAYLEGPYGDFTLDKSKKKRQIWLAGGVGITPFISFLSSLDCNNADKKIHMIYCVNSKEEAIYLDYLKGQSDTMTCFDFSLYESNKEGFINAEKVKDISGMDLKESDIFICAPPAMIKSLKKQFLSVGVNKNSIISEEFNF